MVTVGLRPRGDRSLRGNQLQQFLTAMGAPHPCRRGLLDPVSMVAAGPRPRGNRSLRGDCYPCMLLTTGFLAPCWVPEAPLPNTPC